MQRGPSWESRMMVEKALATAPLLARLDCHSEIEEFQQSLCRHYLRAMSIKIVSVG